jgi:outer membrane immunogenic protein
MGPAKMVAVANDGVNTSTGSRPVKRLLHQPVLANPWVWPLSYVADEFSGEVNQTGACSSDRAPILFPVNPNLNSVLRSIECPDCGAGAYFMALCFRAGVSSLAIIALTIASASNGQADEWTGTYVGFGIGVDALTGKGGATNAAGSVVEADGVNGGDLGLSLRVGADYQFSRNFVAGVTAIYDWSNIDTSGRVTDGPLDASINLAKLDYSLTIAARAGYLLTPSLLAYGLAGYSRISFDDVTFSVPGASGTIDLSSYDSFVFGGGFEYHLTSNWSLFGEYRRADLDRQDIYAVNSRIGALSIWADPVMHWARVGAAYRFNGRTDEATPPSEPANWSGFYAAGGIGLDAATRDLDAQETGCVAPNCQTLELDGIGGGGFGATVTAGYDHRFNTFVAGAFVDYDWSDQDIAVTASFRGQSLSADLLSLDKSWTVGARLGFLAADDVLIYGLVGYTHLTFDDASISGAGRTFSFGMPSFDGITLGTGFEKLLTSNVSLRLEYRYVNLGEEQSDFGTTQISLDPSVHNARAMVGYRF